jgi:hypothetical protein
MRLRKQVEVAMLDARLHEKHATLVTHALDFWLARGAVLAVVALQLLLVNDLSLGLRWIASTLELALLAPLSVATAWVQREIKHGPPGVHPSWTGQMRLWIRRSAILLTMLITALNFLALYLLLRALLGGHAGSGKSLLVDSVNIWLTNVIAFALWYWNIDRGGPAIRGLIEHNKDDFLFPQMTVPNRRTEVPPLAWTPGFVDYLFLSFTNATAFSPTDTLPLSGRAKLLMMGQAGLSLITLALVAARAVNILA